MWKALRLRNFLSSGSFQSPHFFAQLLPQNIRKTIETQHPAVIGLDGEFLASGRLDNLACTHAGLVAIESVCPGGDVAVFVAFVAWITRPRG